MSETLPEGFECKCGKWHKFSTYVYAKFRNILDFRCDACNRDYKIIWARAAEAEKLSLGRLIELGDLG